MSRSNAFHVGFSSSSRSWRRQTSVNRSATRILANPATPPKLNVDKALILRDGQSSGFSLVPHPDEENEVHRRQRSGVAEQNGSFVHNKDLERLSPLVTGLAASELLLPLWFDASSCEGDRRMPFATEAATAVRGIEVCGTDNPFAGHHGPLPRERSGVLSARAVKCLLK
jgi:hypothetical protein